MLCEIVKFLFSGHYCQVSVSPSAGHISHTDRNSCLIDFLQVHPPAHTSMLIRHADKSHHECVNEIHLNYVFFYRYFIVDNNFGIHADMVKANIHFPTVSFFACMGRLKHYIMHGCSFCRYSIYPFQLSSYKSEESERTHLRRKRGNL